MRSEDALDQPPPPADHRFVYGAAPSQFIDVRVPVGSGPFPCALLIHGGFWKEEYGLDYFGHVAGALCSVGFVVANIEYRRVGEGDGGWPGTFEDVAAAARFVVDNGDEWNLDRSRLIALGHSAGGHLALWLAGQSAVPPESPVAGSGVDLAGVVSLGGVADLIDVDDRRLGDDAVRRLLAGGQAAFPERYRAASPAALLPLGVPQLLVHGEDDEDVPIEHARLYLQKAEEAGDRIDAVFLAKTGYFEIVDPTSEVWPRVLAAIVAMVPGNEPGG